MLYEPERCQTDEHGKDRRVPAAISQTDGVVSAKHDTSSYHRQGESADRELPGNAILYQPDVLFLREMAERKPVFPVPAGSGQDAATVCDPKVWRDEK